MDYRTTHAYDYCPRCKSGQIEATKFMYGENKWAIEHLHCKNCDLDFEQHYEYVCTYAEWNDEEELDERGSHIDLLEARNNAYRRHGAPSAPTAHVYD